MSDRKKPFLNLFDEGRIVDQRGVKAHAERAIIILTTNAGDRNVSQMARSGKPPEEIAERVKQALSKVRHERSSQPVFPPQFLSRIKRIIVFNPLDEAAMIAQRAKPGGFVNSGKFNVWFEIVFAIRGRRMAAQRVAPSTRSNTMVVRRACHGKEKEEEETRN